MANYDRKLRIGVNIQKKKKVEKVTEFVEKMKKIQKEVGVVLKKVQKEMKQQADKERKEVKEWKKENKVMLNMKDLVFKKQLAKKLVDQYIDPYIIDKVMSTNVVWLNYNC